MSRLTELDENPIRVVRRATGLSLRKAADLVPCTYQALTYVEYGLYDQVLPVVLDWAVVSSDYTKYEICDAYIVYKMKVRRESSETLGLHKLLIDSLGVPGMNPIRQMRSSLGMSTYAFCRALCVPVALLYTSETQAKSLPERMKYALQECNVPHHVIAEIADRYGELDD